MDKAVVNCGLNSEEPDWSCLYANQEGADYICDTYKNTRLMQ